MVSCAQAVLRHVPHEGIVSKLTQRWDAGGQGNAPAGNRRSSSAAAAAAASDSCSLSVRRWDELVKEVNEEVGGLMALVGGR